MARHYSVYEHEEDCGPASLDPKSNRKSLIWYVAALLPGGQSGRDWTKEEVITYSV